MKVLVAPDKFKHSLSSSEACLAIEAGLLRANAELKIDLFPMADGGDGVSDVIYKHLNCTELSIQVLDPLFRPIITTFLLSTDRKTAYIEMAKASGIALLKTDEFGCMDTSSIGTGQLIKEALKYGVENVVLGIGGSATNDCGIGMASALGYRFLDLNGNELEPVGRNLINICTIDNKSAMDLSRTKFKVACDVRNPLTGPKGATRTFAAQKGATEQEIELLEHGMIQFSSLLKEQLRKNVMQVEGAGAAGGVGAGAMAFLNAELVSGIDLMLNLSNAEQRIIDCDLVITGEGKLDGQSLNGKVVSGLLSLCRKHNKPLYVLCGRFEFTKDIFLNQGINGVYDINPPEESLEDSIRNAKGNLEETAFKLGKLLFTI